MLLASLRSAGQQQENPSKRIRAHYLDWRPEVLPYIPSVRPMRSSPVTTTAWDQLCCQVSLQLPVRLPAAAAACSLQSPADRTMQGKSSPVWLRAEACTSDTTLKTDGKCLDWPPLPLRREDLDQDELCTPMQCVECNEYHGGWSAHLVTSGNDASRDRCTTNSTSALKCCLSRAAHEATCIISPGAMQCLRCSMASHGTESAQRSHPQAAQAQSWICCSTTG